MSSSPSTSLRMMPSRRADGRNPEGSFIGASKLLANRLEDSLSRGKEETIRFQTLLQSRITTDGLLILSSLQLFGSCAVNLYGRAGNYHCSNQRSMFSGVFSCGYLQDWSPQQARPDWAG